MLNSSGFFIRPARRISHRSPTGAKKKQFGSAFCFWDIAPDATRTVFVSNNEPISRPRLVQIEFGVKQLWGWSCAADEPWTNFRCSTEEREKKRGGVAKRYLLKRSIPAIITKVLEVRGCLSEAYAAMPLQEKSKKHLRKKKKKKRKESTRRERAEVFAQGKVTPPLFYRVRIERWWWRRRRRRRLLDKREHRTQQQQRRALSPCQQPAKSRLGRVVSGLVFLPSSSLQMPTIEQMPLGPVSFCTLL